MSRQFLLVATFFCASSCFAALPPLWNSVREIEGILKHPDLKEYLDASQTINAIERVPGGFRVITNTSKVLVELSPRHDQHVGPVQYEYTFSSLGENEP